MSSDKDRYKKSPQGLCRAGFQDFPGRIRKSKWWSWRELNLRPKFPYILGTTCLVSLYIRLPAADRHATNKLA